MQRRGTTPDDGPDALGPPRDAEEATREAWYCAGPSRLARAGALASLTLLGERILVGRDREGRLFALRDRCPHRGSPLSRGSFDGEAVTCPFHGWRFSTGGTCLAMPALSKAEGVDPGTVSVASFPIKAVNGLLWIYMGRRPAGAPPIPPFSPAGDQRARIVASVTVEASFDLCVLSLIDPGHVGYVHNAWWWRPSGTAREKVKDFVPLPFGFRMTAHEAAGNSRGYRLLGRPRTQVDFLLPGQRIERIEVGSRSVVNATFATPIGPRRTMFTNVIVSDMPQVALLSAPLRWAATAFLRQDQRILELAQEGLDRKPTMILLGNADRLAQWYYALKRDYAAAQREDRSFQNRLAPAQLRWRT